MNKRRLQQKSFKWVRKAVLMLMAACSVASCGLFDFDIDVDETPFDDSEVAFSLDRDTLYMMAGEEYVFQPTFSPDMNENNVAFYLSMADSVATVIGDTVLAQREGWTVIRAMSVATHLTDSCLVYVLPDWQPSLRVYPYYTAVYANVTVGGNPVNDNMIVAAFVDSDLRAIGQVYEQNGVSVMRFRVGSESLGDDMNDDSNLDDDEEKGETVGDNPWNREIVYFRCYDRSTHRLYDSRIRVIFNGNAHGTPSTPIPLVF